MAPVRPGATRAGRTSAGATDADRAADLRGLDGATTLGDLHLTGLDQPGGRATCRLHQRAPAVALPFVHRPCGVGGADRGFRITPLQQLQNGPFQASVHLPLVVLHSPSVAPGCSRARAPAAALEAYAGYTQQTVRLQERSLTGSYATTTSHITGTGSLAGVEKQTRTATTDRCYRYKFEGTSTTPPVTATGDCVDVR